MSDTKTLNVEQIKELLAHRYPMLLVDKVLDYEPMKFIHAVKNISYNEPQFQGHFPEKSIFPGVMIIEAMAQATGLLSSLSFEINGDHLFYLVSIDDCRFKKMIVPGDVMHIKIQAIGKPKIGMWRFDCTAIVDSKIATKAKLMCASR